MAALSKTYSGDLSEFIAGKIWNEVKRRSDEREIEKREGDPAVKKAAKELLKDDDKSTPVVDKPLRDNISKIFGGGIDVKLLRVENKVNTLSDNVNAVAAGIADTQKLIINQNEILESKFDEILKIFGIQTEQKKEELEAEKYRQLELDLEEKKIASKARDIINLGGVSGGGDLSIWFARMLMKGGGSLSRRLFNRFASTRLRRRTAVTLGKLSARRWTSKGMQILARRVPGGNAIRNRVIQEVATRTAIRRGGKTGTKALLKKVPLVSLVAGTLFAVERALKGDAEGAALEFASGLAGTVPGKGTALSVLIDGILLNRDLNSGGYERGYEKGKNRGRIDPRKPWHGTEAGLTENTIGDIMGTFKRSIIAAGTAVVSAAVGYGDAIGLGTPARAAVIDAGLGKYKLEPIPFYTNVGDTGAVDSLGNTFKSKFSTKLPDWDLTKREKDQDEVIKEGDDEDQNKPGPLETIRNMFNFNRGQANTPGRVSSANLNHNGMIVGYVGNTGRSTGPHIHIEQHPRTTTGNKQLIPQHVMDNIIVGGRPLSSWPTTSPIGWRQWEDGSRQWHHGRDFADSDINGQPIQLTGPMKYIDFQSQAGGGGRSGNNILLSDGTNQYAIFHLQDGYNPDVSPVYTNKSEEDISLSGSRGGSNISNNITNETSRVSTGISDIQWTPPSYTKNEVARTVQQNSSTVNHHRRSAGSRLNFQTVYLINNIDNSTSISFGSKGSSSQLTLEDIQLARLE